MSVISSSAFPQLNTEDDEDIDLLNDPRPVNLGAIDDRASFPLTYGNFDGFTSSAEELATDTRSAQERPQENVIYRPIPRTAPAILKVLQEWEGIVTTVNENSFLAELFDLTTDNEPETAKFPMDEVNSDQISLVKPGAPFHWIIGYRDRSGTRERVSQLIFRRLPAWRTEEIKVAKAEAQAIAESYDFD